MESYDVVLITGASAGIGAAYARALAPRCRRLVLVARRSERLEALARELEPAGVEVQTLGADLADTVGVARVVEGIRQLGPLDLLINNAGLGTNGPFSEQTIDSQMQMVRVHIDATLALTRAALPGMREQGRGGVINVSSGAAFVPFAGVAVYGGSKAFLNNFSQALQAEEQDYGIKVQCLCPGYTRTEFHYTDTFRDFDVAQVPEDMWMQPEEVVNESLEALAAGGPVVFVAGARNREMMCAVVRSQLEAMEASL